MKKKQEEMRGKREKAGIEKELKECCFKPSVIGYDYDNSGLTRTEKQFYGVDGARDSQSVKEKSVERRCHEWLQNKEKNQLIREL